MSFVMLHEIEHYFDQNGYSTFISLHLKILVQNVGVCGGGYTFLQGVLGPRLSECI